MPRIRGKQLRFSKTFWIASLQAVAGLIVIFVSDNPTLDFVGILMGVKSIIDIFTRVRTINPIESL